MEWKNADVITDALTSRTAQESERFVVDGRGTVVVVGMLSVRSPVGFRGREEREGHERVRRRTINILSAAWKNLEYCVGTNELAGVIHVCT